MRGFPKKVAVLGSGLMGSQIAAHLVNAGIEVILFGLPGHGANANTKVKQAIDELKTLNPPPFTLDTGPYQIVPANYYQDLDKLKSCDLVIEAISESFDDKEGFYVRIAPYINKCAIFTTTTTKLSINRLAKALPAALLPRFCGMHFLNPPRYQRLVELIPADTTDPQVPDRLENFLVGVLGKGVVRAKDRPYFIANRLGLLAMLVVLYHAERFSLAPDLVDELSIAGFGLNAMAIFKRLDEIGLTTFSAAQARIARTFADDPWFTQLVLPEWLQQLIEQNQTQAAGDNVSIYRNGDQQLEVIDIDHASSHSCFRPYAPSIAAAVQNSLNIDDVLERFAALRANAHPQAQFLWSVLRDVLHYVAVNLDDMARSGHDVDIAMRLGFGWQMGPFETWQALGWRLTTRWLEEEISAQRTLAQIPLPAWVKTINGMYHSKGAYTPSQDTHKPCFTLPVYQRHIYSYINRAYANPTLKKNGKPAIKMVFASESIRLWEEGDGIAILSRQPVNGRMPDGFLPDMQEALNLAEQHYQALILWDMSASVRRHTNLNDTAKTWRRELANIRRRLDERQHIHQRLRTLAIPVIATAPPGIAAQCEVELLLHCDRVVAALECQLGFPRLAEGLFPAHGGCIELIRRAAAMAQNDDLYVPLQFYFNKLIHGCVSQNALQAQHWGLLSTADSVIFNPDELLYVAKAQARSLIDIGYRPVFNEVLPVLGIERMAALMASQVGNAPADGCTHNDPDDYISQRLAYVLCGGEAAENTHMKREQLLALERQAFLEIAQYLNISQA